MAATSTLQDNFNTTIRNTALWNDESFTGGTTSQDGVKLILTPAPNTINTGAEYDSVNAYNMTGSYIQAQILQVASQNCETILMGQIDSSNRVYMDQKAGVLSALSNATTGGFLTIATISYNATTMARWRVRESGGVIFWDYSAEGLSWINLGQETARIAVTALKIQLGTFDGSSDSAPGTAWFDNLNIPTGVNDMLTMFR